MIMQIKIGDLFDYAKRKCIIAHGCNVLGKMGSGFARQIKLTYPEAYVDYARYCKDKDPQLGEVFLYRYPVEEIYIANIFTQDKYGKDESVVYTDEDAIRSGLIEVRKLAIHTGLPVYIPFIGVGLGNGDAGRILRIMTNSLDDVNATLFLYP